MNWTAWLAPGLTAALVVCATLPAAAGHSPRLETEIAFLRLLAALDLCERSGECADCVSTLGEFEGRVRERPEDGRARYWLGVVYLRRPCGERREAEARAQIEAALEGRLYGQIDRLRVQTDLGAAHLASGDPDAALAVFEEVAKKNPDDPVFWLRYAQALDLLGRTEEAKQERDKAEAAGLSPGSWSPEDFERIEPSLWNGDPRPTPKRLAGRLALAAGSDSNPGLLADELVLLTADGQLLEGAEADGLLHLAARIDARPLVARGRQGWSVAVGLEGQRSFYQDLDDLDVEQLGAVAQTARGSSPSGFLSGPLGDLPVAVDVGSSEVGSNRLSLLAQAAFGQVWLGGESYLRRTEAALSVTLPPAKLGTTRIDLMFEDQDFRAGDRRRSGERATLGLHQTLALGGRLTLALRLRGGERWAQPAYRCSRLEGGAALGLRLGSAWALHLDLGLLQDDFDSPQSNLFDPSGPPREDTTWRAGATVLWTLPSGWQLQLLIHHADRDSNVLQASGLPGLDYERTTGVIGFEWRF